MTTFLKRSALSILAASTLFLWIPLYVIYLALSDVNFSIKDFFIFSLALTLCASLAFLAISSILTKLGLDWFAKGTLYFLIFWTSLSGLLFPLSGKAGMISPEDLPTNFNHLAIVACSTLALTALTFTKIKPATQAFALILISTSLASAAYTLIETGASMNRFSGLSEKDNVIVLSFDGLAGNIAKDVLENNPSLKNALKDFIFYDNTASTAPATIASLRSELYGNIDFRALSPTEDDLKSILIKNTNSIKREQQSGADVITYGVYSMFNGQLSDVIIPGTLIANGFSEQASITLNFYPHIAARIGTPVLAKLVITELRDFKDTYLQDAKAKRALAHKGVAWDAQNTLQNEDLIALTQNLHTTDSPRSFRLMHFLHTHFPVDLDENCTYRSDNAEWFNANQNYHGLYNETHCALVQAVNYLNKLKALGIYDKTTFILKSDHGAPANYFESGPDSITFNNHPLWGYNRYRPLLMIKPRSGTHESIIYNNESKSLADLARTLCLHSPDNSKCAEYEGIDLLGDNAQQTDEKIYLDVVKDQESTFEFDTQITAAIPRDNDFISALRSTGVVTLQASELTNYKQRLSDLTKIRDALELYRQVNGSYPPSQDYDGLHSIWGRSAADWIPGLAPTYIAKLPRDPEYSEEKIPQYLYRSNRSSYKLLAHGTDASCMIAARLNPELVDPIRRCFAFGYWSEGAQGW
ncbi:hypothetical protein IFR35_15635 [Pseudomonas fluorescens]|uniref:hypothetical protein n=1 Tax=Pseudomonas fluorescens TaxID=294 RepID=UPI0017827C0A|nr:hypothetical protein [Pseudomonas fluorescens]MBD8192857.1 hypothetical protein [Pseudomonas fluorescens]MBD8227679.1 hypothetical protein [Pseudomonas fluorescens]MBD8785645.1 hypothetical protein [Pseudomonas fluorescens]MBD8817874.1 hypothetical protein [Pseudomonas fluorescens]